MTAAATEESVYVHPTAQVSPLARLGAGTRVWNWAQVRDGAVLGEACIVGKGVYIDAGVQIGRRAKIQNHVSIYRGVTLEDGVFVGPHVCFTNDRLPRAINPDGTLKSDTDWVITPTVVRTGAALGAASVIVAGVTIGRWALVGAGAVVTRDVPDHGLVMGNPARLEGYVCFCAQRLILQGTTGYCPSCGAEVDLMADNID
jgi:acetyltransferase-like isoleucine patch superfamily enzyme